MEGPQRFSKKRQAIYEALMDSLEHPNAEMVYQSLKADYPDLSLGTVYRNLAMFRTEGTIQSLGTVNGMERYDGTIEPHTHFICTNCGQVLDLETVELPEEVLQKAAQAAGGTIRTWQLLFNGTCNHCIEENN